MPGTSIGIAPVKPAFVAFETRPVEDRTATIAEGRYMTKDVDFAIVTPPGSKDRIERKLPDWFDQLATEVSQERYPSEWLHHYRMRYKEWKAGMEPTVEGTHIRMWNALSPSQMQQLLALGIQTVEQVAEANSEAVMRMGMGGQSLKQNAQRYLATAKDLGVQATQIVDLQAQLTEANRKLAVLEAAQSAGNVTKKA